MTSEDIIEKSTNYFSVLTTLTPNMSSEFDNYFNEVKNWFESIPREFFVDSVLVRKYACYSHYYRWTEKYTEVFRCATEIKEIVPSVEDSLYCGLVYRDASRVADFMGMINESIEYGYKAIAMIEKSGKKAELGKCYNLIGACLNPLNSHDDSFEFLKKAYKIAVELNADTSKVFSLNNMGYNRILAKDYDLAERILLKANDILKNEQKRLDLHIQVNNNLATVALNKNDFNKAHEYISKAKYYNSFNKSASDLISTLEVESSIYLKENKPQEAIQTLLKALELTSTKKMEHFGLRIEKTISKILSDEKRFEEATEHLKNCLILQEKVTNDISQSQIQIIHYENEVRETRAILEKRLQQSINTISRIGELRDVYTAGHQRRVKNLACAIARELGLSDSAIMNLSYGSLIHDIGKIYIASDILNKPGKISNLEYQILQTHSEHGYNVVKEVDFPEVIPTMIYQHHERVDGSGYPNHLTGDQILIESKILAVADVVEAMSSHRPYRPALGIDVALEEINSYKGKKFDEKVVEVCIQLFKEKGFRFEDK